MKVAFWPEISLPAAGATRVEPWRWLSWFPAGSHRPSKYRTVRNVPENTTCWRNISWTNGRWCGWLSFLYSLPVRTESMLRRYESRSINGDEATCVTKPQWGRVIPGFFPLDLNYLNISNRNSQKRRRRRRSPKTLPRWRLIAANGLSSVTFPLDGF